MFRYAESNSNGTRDETTETTLWPGPTHPVYPETRFKYNIQETDAGVGVRQRTKKQGTEYSWVWVGYSPTTPRYEDQYWELFELQSHIRAENGDNPHVYLWEDVTLNFGKYNDATNKIEPAWVRVLITFVGRKETSGGGRIRYDETVVKFVIADPTITNIV